MPSVFAHARGKPQQRRQVREEGNDAKDHPDAGDRLGDGPGARSRDRRSGDRPGRSLDGHCRGGTSGRSALPGPLREGSILERRLGRDQGGRGQDHQAERPNRARDGHLGQPGLPAGGPRVPRHRGSHARSPHRPRATGIASQGQRDRAAHRRAQGLVGRAVPGPVQEGVGARAAQLAAVGQPDDSRHEQRLVCCPAREQGRPRGDHGHRYRRVAPRHRAQLQPRAQPELHRRRPARRRVVRGGPRRVVHRSCRRRRKWPRDARRGHRRLTHQRARRVRRRAERDAGQPACRAGLRLLLPPGDPGWVDIRGRHRRRHREHELLHRSVAVQLPQPPGRFPGGAGAAGPDHRRLEPGAGLRLEPRRDARRRCGQPGPGSGRPDEGRREQPRLSARARKRLEPSTTPAWTSRPRATM
jgi:hypothetical protein